jgi:ankyrin repeat protein
VTDGQWLTDVLAGGDANTRTASGDTAAHVLVRTAASADSIHAPLTALLARGLDLSALNHTGQTALDTAAREDVRALVVSLGGKSAKQAVKPTPSHRGK